MINEYQTYNCKILNIKNEGSDSKTFILELPYKEFYFTAGQYVMASLPGFGEAAISVSSALDEEKFIELTIRRVGSLTEKIHQLNKGDYLGVRGPYGNGFPLKIAQNKNILIVAGGIGIEPVRPIILDALKNTQKYKSVTIFYGAKDESAVVYANECSKWNKVCDFNLILEKTNDKKVNQGMITALFDLKNVPKDAIAYMCGPPVMYKFVVQKMLEQGFSPDNIYISFERHMDCAQGICQHCAVGPYYVCQDGPVFGYSQIKDASWLKII